MSDWSPGLEHEFLLKLKKAGVGPKLAHVAVADPGNVAAGEIARLLAGKVPLCLDADLAHDPSQRDERPWTLTKDASVVPVGETFYASQLELALVDEESVCIVDTRGCQRLAEELVRESYVLSQTWRETGVTLAFFGTLWRVQQGGETVDMVPCIKICGPGCGGSWSFLFSRVDYIRGNRDKFREVRFKA